MNSSNKQTNILEELIQRYIPENEFPEWFQTIRRQDEEDDILDFTVQLYTPSSDLAVGFRQNQVIWGRDGDDILLGFDPTADKPGQLQVDIFIGDGEVPGLIPGTPTQRSWTDKFILGDWKQPYYANNGNNDFAIIVDFNPTQDFIQLHGSAKDYRLVESSLGTEIWWQQGNKSDLIAVLPLVSNLSLGSNYFQFEGKTPPRGPVLGQTLQFGTAKFDLPSGVDTDASGNVYIAGGTTGAFEGSNAGSRDAWFSKYDSNGNLLKMQQFGSSSFDMVYNIATDAAGNSYLAGYTEGNLARPKQASYCDAWIAKYDSNGNQEWIRQFGTDIINVSFDIDVDDKGNVYQTGFTVDDAPQGAQFPTEDNFWVTKYDSNGNRQWFSEFGDPETFDEAYGVAFDLNGNVYASGWTLGDLEGENDGGYDAWVAKYDSQGDQEWIQQFGSKDYEFCWDVATDSKGNSYATGWTLGDLEGKNAGGYDAWVVKYDSQGRQKWIEQFGLRGDDEASGLAVDLNGNIFLTGYTTSNLEGTNAGQKDAWVARYDTNGDRQWIQQFGTADADFSNAVNFDNAGHLFVTGVTEGSFGGINAGSWDGWVAKLNLESGTLLDFSGTA